MRILCELNNIARRSQLDFGFTLPATYPLYIAAAKCELESVCVFWDESQNIRPIIRLFIFITMNKVKKLVPPERSPVGPQNRHSHPRLFPEHRDAVRELPRRRYSYPLTVPQIPRTPPLARSCPRRSGPSPLLLPSQSSPRRLQRRRSRRRRRTPMRQSSRPALTSSSPVTATSR